MNFIQYLKSLDSDTLNEVYTSSHTCSALMKSLPPLAQQYLLRVLPVPSVSLDTFEQWIEPSAKGAHNYCMDLLQSLKIFSLVPNPTKANKQK